MNKQQILVFGYGSLLNDQSRLRSAPQSVVVSRQAVLTGYQRIFNIAYGEHVYANVQQQVGYRVVGTVMSVTPAGFDELCERERNYQAVDIVDKLEGDWNEPVYAFIGTDNTVGTETIKQSYIDLCLSGVPQTDQQQWLTETIMYFPIQTNV